MLKTILGWLYIFVAILLIGHAASHDGTQWVASIAGGAFLGVGILLFESRAVERYKIKQMGTHKRIPLS